MESRKEVCSSRWQPTKEQVEILESVYSAGVKTPSAEQIQQITARLSVYGEIEGKNVFYWFQNTKARRRQKVKDDRRLAYLSRFCPPLFPGYVPPILPNGVVSEMAAGYYYYPYGGGGGGGVNFEYGMARVESTRASRECKTLELFPLHPESMAEDEDCYRHCASACASYDNGQEVQVAPGFIDFLSGNNNGNGCSTAVTAVDRSRG